jgi:hypothetical protein
MKKLHTIATTFLLASTAILNAEDDGRLLKPYIAGGFNLSQGDSRDLTQQGWNVGSFTGEFGVEFAIPNSTLVLRPNVGMSKMVGDKQSMPLMADGIQIGTIGRSGIYDMMAIYGALDLVYSPLKKWKWSAPIFFTTGPTLLTWNVDELYPPPETDYNQHDKGLKMGWRVGVGYVINSNLRVELTYTLSEWRSNRDLPYVSGWNPSRPSFFCLKASYSY